MSCDRTGPASSTRPEVVLPARVRSVSMRPLSVVGGRTVTPRAPATPGRQPPLPPCPDGTQEGSPLEVILTGLFALPNNALQHPATDNLHLCPCRQSRIDRSVISHNSDKKRPKDPFNPEARSFPATTPARAASGSLCIAVMGLFADSGCTGRFDDEIRLD